MELSDDIPERELAEQAKEALATFISCSNRWIERVPYTLPTRTGRRFQNKFLNANVVAIQMFASLNDKVVLKCQVRGHASPTDGLSAVEE